MGCDIHAYIENNYDEDGCWESFARLYMNRDYELFGLLAGVRGGRIPVVSPKGLPLTPGFQLSLDWKDMEGDGHSPTWLTLEELQRVSREINSMELKAVIGAMQELSNPRFVCFFDS